MEPHTSDAPADPPPSSSLRQTRTQDPSGPRPSSFPFLAPAQSPTRSAGSAASACCGCSARAAWASCSRRRIPASAAASP